MQEDVVKSRIGALNPAHPPRHVSHDDSLLSALVCCLWYFWVLTVHFFLNIERNPWPEKILTTSLITMGLLIMYDPKQNFSHLIDWYKKKNIPPKGTMVIEQDIYNNLLHLNSLVCVTCWDSDITRQCRVQAVQHIDSSVLSFRIFSL